MQGFRLSIHHPNDELRTPTRDTDIQSDRTCTDHFPPPTEARPAVDVVPSRDMRRVPNRFAHVRRSVR